MPTGEKYGIRLNGTDYYAPYNTAGDAEQDGKRRTRAGGSYEVIVVKDPSVFR